MGSGERTRANSRAALVDAAYEEFSSKGYEAATVAGIAERAGVTTGALYAHFSGKLDLLLATLGLAPIEEVLGSVADLASLPWHEASAVVRRGMTPLPVNRLVLLLDVIVVARRDPHVADVLRQGLESYLDAMKRATDTGTERGLVDPALPGDDLARMLLLVNLGIVVFGALDAPMPSKVAFERLAELLMRPAVSDDAQPPALARAQTRAAAVRRARQAFEDAIAQAVEDGHSLRQVAAAAGVSHEQIRRVLGSR